MVEPIRTFLSVSAQEVDNVPFEPGPEAGQVVYVSPGEGDILASGDGVAVVWDVWGKKKAAAPSGDALQNIEVATLSPGGETLARLRV